MKNSKKKSSKTIIYETKRDASTQEKERLSKGVQEKIIHDLAVRYVFYSDGSVQDYLCVTSQANFEL